jgi:hypothetical protein
MRLSRRGMSGRGGTSFGLRSITLPIFALICALTSESLAVSFPIGEEIVSIGQNFTGASLATSGFIPPDTMGAVGPTAFVELINGNYSVYDKSSGALVQTTTLDQFWRNSGVTSTTSAFDPRVVYDPSSERYFAASGDNARNPNSSFLIAASRTSDPTQGWTGFSIKSDVTQQRWADFPTLGFNREGVYLSANMLNLPGTLGGETTTIVAVPKTDLLAPTPTVANATIFQNQIEPGPTAQPVVDLDNKRSSAVLVSNPFVLADALKRSDILGDIRAPKLNSPSAFIPLSPFFQTFGAMQPGRAANLEISGGSHLSSNVVLQNNTLWGVQTVSDNGQAALRWFKVDVDTNTLLQEGLIKKTGLDLFYGSIAVNKTGEVVIGFTGSGKTQFASAYAAAGVTINGKTIFGEPLLLRQGVASYELFGNGRNRWGDYSATTVDPSNSKSFWTIQEWASGPTSWSTQITELRFGVVAAPEPSTLLLLSSGLAGMAGWRWCAGQGRTQKL